MAVDVPQRSLWGRVDHLLHEAFANQGSRLYGAVSNFVILVIFYSIATIVMESVESIHL